MKRFDCGNQRTGQARWAEFIAKTWEVSGGVGVGAWLRQAARRVSPSGNWPMLPRLTHSSYARFWPRIAGERTYRKMGTARTAPATTLKRMPILVRNPRLEDWTSGLIDSLP